MIATSAIEVRNLKDGESLPAELVEGFPPGWQSDTYWTWVAEVEGEIVGYLLAGHVQGIVMLMMLKSKDRHDIVLPRLLRTFLKDCLARGYSGWMTYFNIDKLEQRKLKRIAMRAGAVVFPYRIICVGGRLQDAARW